MMENTTICEYFIPGGRNYYLLKGIIQKKNFFGNISL